MIADVLTGGAAGLTFFETFLGRANSAGAALDVTPGDIAARYYEQCDVHTDALAAAGESLLAASRDLDAVVAGQRVSRSRLEESWSGTAADACVAMIDAQIGSAGIDINSLRAAAEGLAAAAAAVESTAVDKAVTAATFGRLDVDGRSADQIDVVLAVARSSPDPTPDQLLSIAAFHPQSAPGAARSDPTALMALSTECASWLNGVFVPTVRERVSAFLELCTATDDAVRGILTAAASAFEPFAQSNYPAPQSTPATAPCGCPPSTTADGGAHQRISEPAEPSKITPPETSAPPYRIPTSDEAQRLARAVVDTVREVLASELRDVVDQPTVAESGESDAQPADVAQTHSAATPSAAMPKEVAHLEAEFDGHGIRFALSADGSIGIDITDADPDEPDCVTDAAADPQPDTPAAEAPAADPPAPDTVSPAVDSPDLPSPAPEPVPPVGTDDGAPVCAPETEPAPDAEPEPTPADAAAPVLAEAGGL
ncbi:hypothetical protein ACNHUS_01720 [Actinomycetes bacterium M1A6_2h]